MPLKRLHIACLLLLVLTGGPLLLMLSLQVRQAWARHEAEERLEREAAQTLVMAPSELVWEKPGKEIRYQGRLFDIKTVREEDGKVVVTGLFDDQETAIKQHLSHSGKHLPFLQLFSLSLMVEFGRAATPPPVWTEAGYRYFCPPFQSPVDPYRPVPTPPPLGLAVYL